MAVLVYVWKRCLYVLSFNPLYINHFLPYCSKAGPECRLFLLDTQWYVTGDSVTSLRWVGAGKINKRFWGSVRRGGELCSVCRVRMLVIARLVSASFLSIHKSVCVYIVLIYVNISVFCHPRELSVLPFSLGYPQPLLSLALFLWKNPL